MGAERAVWVTRTEPGASRLAARLEGLGYRVVKLPLLDIQATPAAALAAQARAAAHCSVCIALSGHAVRFGLSTLLAQAPALQAARWLAVGRGTAAALARHGIDAACPDSDTLGMESSEGILALLGEVGALEIALLCGVGGRTLLTEELTRRGGVVHRIEAYRREPAPIDAEAFADRLAGVAVALVASAEAGKPLARLVPAPARARLQVIAGSERIARVLETLGFGNVAVAAGPGDDAMVSALALDRGTRDERAD